jgi:transcriptional regulator with XRE-family HTH domain
VTNESIDQLRAFGIALRTYRTRARLTQEALADLAGLHRTYIGSVERGERNVSLLNIHVLADALRTSAAELIRTAQQVSTSKPGRAAK